MRDLSTIVSAGVGPIIVISACGLLCLAFYNRLSAVVSRVRAFQREILRETEGLKRAELLAMLHDQTSHSLRRARLIRLTLFCLLTTIACLAVCSLCLGLTVYCQTLLVPAAVCFVAGLASLLVGILVAMVELKASLDPVELESRFMAQLAEEA
jgi:hypothetical protein